MIDSNQRGHFHITRLDEAIRPRQRSRPLAESAGRLSADELLGLQAVTDRRAQEMTVRTRSGLWKRSFNLNSQNFREGSTRHVIRIGQLS